MNKSQQKKSLSVACTYVDLNSTDNLNLALIRPKKMKISKKKNASEYKLFTFPFELDSCYD